MNDEQSLPEEEAKDYEIVEEEPRPAGPEDGRARPRRRKKKSRLSDEMIARHDTDDPSARALPLAVLGFGGVMSLAAAGGLGGNGFILKAVAAMLVYLIFLLPLSVGALMAVGTYAGVSYGEYKLAILKLSAIAFFNNGVMWLNAWAGAPSYMAIMMCSFICFGLFIMLYDLDVWEAWISVIALNAVQFTAHLFVVMVIAAGENHSQKKQGHRPPPEESCIQRMIDC